jgi:hypothetical protein
MGFRACCCQIGQMREPIHVARRIIAFRPMSFYGAQTNGKVLVLRNYERRVSSIKHHSILPSARNAHEKDPSSRR